MASDPKRAVLAHLAALGAALAHPARLQILDLLAQAEHTVESIARKTDVPLKSTSAHLRVLRHAGLVTTRRAGTFVVYRLADAEVQRLLAMMMDIAERQSADVRELARQFFEDPDGLEPVSATELRRRLDRGEVTLIDVRPADEFRQAHIAGARSMPLDTIARHVAELPRNRTVVAYCRGATCVLAASAVRRLRRAGFTAQLLRDGVPDWQRRGFSVARPPELQGIPS